MTRAISHVGFLEMCWCGLFTRLDEAIRHIYSCFRRTSSTCLQRRRRGLLDVLSIVDVKSESGP